MKSLIASIQGADGGEAHLLEATVGDLNGLCAAAAQALGAPVSGLQYFHGALNIWRDLEWDGFSNNAELRLRAKKAEFKVRALVDDKRVPKHLRDALEDLRAKVDCRVIAVKTDEGVKIICFDCNTDGMLYNIDNLRYSHFKSSKHINAGAFQALHLLCGRGALPSEPTATAYARTFGIGVTPLAATAEDAAWGSPLSDKEDKLRKLLGAHPCLADDSSTITPFARINLIGITAYE